MRDMGTGDFIVLLGGAALGGFAFLAISDFAIVRADWCVAGEADCLREWIGALSGWAAAIAAGATITFLAGQMREARRQTAFVVGDALPTVELEESDEGFSVVDVVITNWNRRSIEVEDITAEGQTVFGSIEFQDPMLQVLQTVNPETEGVHFTIPGWLDRTKPPPRVRVSIQMFAKKDGPIEGTLNVPVGARVKLKIIGARHERVELIAENPEHLTI